MSRPCDFCTTSPATHAHGLRGANPSDRTENPQAAHGHKPHTGETLLLACEVCTELIKSRSWEALATRASHAVVARLEHQEAAAKAVAHITQSLREMAPNFTGDVSPWNEGEAR